MLQNPALLWFVALAGFGTILALDLGVIQKRRKLRSFSEAAAWTATLVVLALAFSALIYVLYNPGGWQPPRFADASIPGADAARTFAAAYLGIWSVSLDAMLIVALIATRYGLSSEDQDRLVRRAILAFIALRAFIVPAVTTGVNLLPQLVYVLGALLLYGAWKIGTVRHDSRIRGSGPNARVLLAAGLLSINAAGIGYAETADPFLLIAANALALLGMRSLYVVVVRLMHRLRRFKLALSIVLAYFGIKLLLHDFYMPPPGASFAMMASMVILGAILVAHRRGDDPRALLSPIANDLEQVAMTTVREGKRIIILLVGSTLLIIGAALLVLPGPGILTIFAGLTLLAVEFAWARRWLVTLRKRFGDVRSKLDGYRKSRQGVE